MPEKRTLVLIPFGRGDPGYTEWWLGYEPRSAFDGEDFLPHVCDLLQAALPQEVQLKHSDEDYAVLWIEYGSNKAARDAVMAKLNEESGAGDSAPAEV